MSICLSLHPNQPRRPSHSHALLQTDLDLGTRLLLRSKHDRVAPLHALLLELCSLGRRPLAGLGVEGRTETARAECAFVALWQKRTADLLAESDQERVDRPPELDGKPSFEVASVMRAPHQFRVVQESVHHPTHHVDVRGRKKGEGKFTLRVPDWALSCWCERDASRVGS